MSPRMWDSCFSSHLFNVSVLLKIAILPASRLIFSMSLLHSCCSFFPRAIWPCIFVFWNISGSVRQARTGWGRERASEIKRNVEGTEREGREVRTQATQLLKIKIQRFDNHFVRSHFYILFYVPWQWNLWSCLQGFLFFCSCCFFLFHRWTQQHRQETVLQHAISEFQANVFPWELVLVPELHSCLN